MIISKEQKTYIFYQSTPGPEYGTMEAAWKSILAEGDRTADLHFKIRDDLVRSIISHERLQKSIYF